MDTSSHLPTEGEVRRVLLLADKALRKPGRANRARPGEQTAEQRRVEARSAIAALLAEQPSEPGGWQPEDTAEDGVFVLVELAGCNIPTIAFRHHDRWLQQGGDELFTVHRWHPLATISPEQPRTKPAAHCDKCDGLGHQNLNECSVCKGTGFSPTGAAK